MNALMTMLKTEITLSFREFSGVLFGILLPAGLILLMGVLYGDKLAYEGASFTMLEQSVGAVVTIGICASGLMGIPITLSGYREKKLLKRFEVSPTSPNLLITVQFLSNLVVAMLSSVLVFAFARIFFNYQFRGEFMWFCLSYLVVVFAIFSMGILIASVSKSVKMSNLLCSLVYFPMFFLSGATVPYEIMPKGLQWVSDWMPLNHGIKLLKGLSVGGQVKDYQNTLFLLMAVGVICTIISIKTFRYDYE